MLVSIPPVSFLDNRADAEYADNLGNIILWTVFESGAGIIAGSLPSLRRLLKNWVHFDSSHGKSSAPVTPSTGPGVSTVTSKVVSRAVKSNYVTRRNLLLI